MPFVRKYITLDSAVRLRKDSLVELKKQLAAASKGVDKIIAVDLADVDDETKGKLVEIQEHLDGVKNEVLAANDDLNTKALIKRTAALVGLFDKLDRDIRFKTTTILAETASVLANSSARSLYDAQEIIDNIDTAFTWKDSTQEYKRIAKEFGKRFPSFLGYRIKTRGTQQGVYVFLENPPPNKSKKVKNVLDALVPKLKEFLEWELQKNGENFEYEIYPLDEGKDKAIACEIESEKF